MTNWVSGLAGGRWAVLATAGLSAMSIGTAKAGTTFDTSLADPPGVYFGTGNANAHFVTGDNNNIELGLGTVKRFITAVTPDAGTSVYHVKTGVTGAAGKTGTDWGFVFSLNTNLSGTGPLTLANIAAQLCVKDVGHNTNTCFNPLAIGDNSHAISSPGTTAQNAEALQFRNDLTPDTRFFDPTFDINANDTYIFSLTVRNSDSRILDSVQMTDIAGTGAAVPEPASIALFGVGLAGLGFVRRRKSA